MPLVEDFPLYFISIEALHYIQLTQMSVMIQELLKLEQVLT